MAANAKRSVDIAVGGSRASCPLVERNAIMNEQENAATVQQAYYNFKTGNIPGLLDQMSDNLTWELPEIDGVPFAGKRTGRG